MGILSDRQIRKLCVEKGMVTPFEEGIKRPGVISYGLSSMGLDVRIGYKFRVFKSYPHDEIDPKNFNPDLLEEVDLTPAHDWADYSPVKLRCKRCGSGVQFDDTPANRERLLAAPCVGGNVPNYIRIPPHSFALGESVEYFLIPRDIQVVVLGKSTYARCFSGDTKIRLLSGKSVSFEAMARRPNIPRWGIGVDIETGRYAATKLSAPRWVGRESLVEVTLDSGEVIRCTPDHEFLRHGGEYTAAQDLVPGDGIVPMYLKEFRGRNSIWIPQMQSWVGLYRLADQWNLDHGVYAAESGTHRHHVDENKQNDNPTNIRRKPASDHIRDHNADYYGEGFDAEEHGRRIRDSLVARMADPAWVAARDAMNALKARRLWDDPQFAVQRARIIEGLRKSWTLEREEEARARMSLYNGTVTFEDRAARWSPARRRKQAEVMRRVNAARGRGNHTVVRVRSVREKHDVYCLTSEDTGNFALASGVVVKNCGLIVNVTPGEPEWKGRWTIEMSNTTPLPIRVYAGEGIMQCLFFRSDEHREGLHTAMHRMTSNMSTGIVQAGMAMSAAHAFDLIRMVESTAGCETSYADKKGKYQDQTGVTPPKVD